ncbi:hypothetical protein [Alteromonas sp. W364]|uniref:hypothetical protein n=1 Tax=Alteromonas sp. W364 TaxID=3075610 RepID=UPI00288618E9|nr:hypothetical protein [Alteromonas sp. W364]MDT0627738.1 hypothetical protein [Alteromonas sp. W364]
MSISIWGLEPDFNELIGSSGVLVIFMFINGLFTALLMGRQEYKLLLSISSLSVVIGLLAAKVLIEGLGVFGGVLALVMFQFLEIVIKGFITYKKFSEVSAVLQAVKIYFHTKALAAFTSLMPLIIASLINAVVFLVARLIVTATEDGLTQLAYFDVAFQFFIVAMLVLNSVTNIFLTKMSTLQLESSIRKMLIQKVSVVLSLAVVGTIIIFFSSEYLVLIFGENYSISEIRMISFCLVPYGFAIVFNRYFILMNNRTNLTIVSSLSGFAMLFFLFCSEKTSIDLTISFIVYYGASTVIYLYLFWKKENDTSTLKESN